MLTQKEKDFIRYWEQNRLRQKKFSRQLLAGLPIGLLFVIPIVIYYSSGWYRKADMEANSSNFNPLVLLIALLIIVGFTSVFYKRQKWDQYEQHYQELLARQHTDDLQSSSPAELQSPPTEPPSPQAAPHASQTDYNSDQQSSGS